MKKNIEPLTVVLTGGGTGGHIYPAISIGRAVQDHYSEAAIVYFGTEQGLEAKLIKEEGWPFYPVAAAGLKRKFSLKVVGSLLISVKGYFQALKQLKRIRPALVIGTGGYVCGPVVLAAANLKIPTIIHEQNAYPGLTNRLLAKVVDQVLVTFPQSKFHFAKKTAVIHTGLPIRENIIQTSRQKGLELLDLQDGFRILIVGGSQGAKSINESMLEVYRNNSKDKNFNWLHIVGSGSYHSYQEKLRQAGIDLATSGNIKIMPYIFQMEAALSVADLVIGRAGASFLAEITAKGLPSILIPYPYAADNHQEFNARALQEGNAAIIFKDGELSGEKLFSTVQELFEHPQKLQEMAAGAKKMGKPDALELILTRIAAILKR
ncbi:MAG: undecaprenyldiphospho-muramoylpentapeptide beta-N-acetylglucosaminyltransferase [Bacillota bacterium]